MSAMKTYRYVRRDGIELQLSKQGIVREMVAETPGLAPGLVADLLRAAMNIGQSSRSKARSHTVIRNLVDLGLIRQGEDRRLYPISDAEEKELRTGGCLICQGNKRPASLFCPRCQGVRLPKIDKELYFGRDNQEEER